MFLKWVCSTFGIGLLPLALRIIIYILLTTKKEFKICDPLDFIILILVISGSIITEIPDNCYSLSKFISMTGVFLSGAFIAIIYLNSIINSFNPEYILFATLILAIAFSLHGISIMYKIAIKMKEAR